MKEVISFLSSLPRREVLAKKCLNQLQVLKEFAFKFKSHDLAWIKKGKPEGKFHHLKPHSTKSCCPLPRKKHYEY